MFIIVLAIPSFAAMQAKETLVENSWYYGIGIGGTLNAKFTLNNSDRTFTQWLEGASDISPLLSMNLKGGWKFNNKLWLGFDSTLVDQSGKFGTTDAKIQIINFLLLATYYPFETGIFLRGGAGLSNLQQQLVLSNVIVNAQKSGTGYLGGIGYAFKFGYNSNITLNLDATKQSYDAGADNLTSSQFTIFYISMDWY